MRANNLRSATVAHAYILQDIAQKMPNTTNTRPAAFESAAQAFLACARDALEGGSVKYKFHHQSAAQCLEEAGNVIQAAENYRIAENFTKATLLFRKLGKFDDVYDIIINHSDKVAPEVLESVRDVTRLYYLTQKKFRWVTYHNTLYILVSNFVFLEKPTTCLSQWKKRSATWRTEISMMLNSISLCSMKKKLLRLKSIYARVVF